MLRGKGQGSFQPVPADEMGLTIEGQIRDMKFLRRAGGERLVAVARNNAHLMLVKPLRLR
jgi:hypothetical protein